MSVLIRNAQDRLNAAQEGLNNQLKSSLTTTQQHADELARDAREAERRAELIQREKRRSDALAATEIQNLQSKLAVAQQEIVHQSEAIQERDRAIAERDALLDQWVVSQNAFMNLFKKFGKTPDGVPIVDLPKPERQQILDDAFGEVRSQRAKETHKPSR